MRFELGVAASAAGLGGKASPHTKGIHQVDDKGNRHPEMRRGRVEIIPADRDSCRFCDSRDICRIEVAVPAATEAEGV